MSDYLTLNNEEHLHISAVKRLSHITDEERQSLNKLGQHVNADRFNTRIDEQDGSKFYAAETINEFAEQGVALVQINERAFIPRKNIKRTKNLTDKDRGNFEQKTGRPMSEKFKSRIETNAGMVLANVDSATIMRRMGHPYQPSSSAPKNIAAQRDGIMANAKQPKPSRKNNLAREAPREPRK